MARTPDESSAEGAARAAGLFEKYCTVGLVVDGAVPFSFRQFTNKAFVAVSVGTSYVIYECEKLGVAIVAPPTSRQIRAVALWKRERTFTASGDAVLLWNRSKHTKTFRHQGAPGSFVDFISCFGNRLITLSAAAQLTCWDALSSVELGTVNLNSFGADDALFRPTAMVHPHGYTNKVLIAGRLLKGGVLTAAYPLLLVNVLSGQLVQQMRGFGAAVSALSQSPAPDVLAVGLDDGRVICHNFLFDRSICTFLHSSTGSKSARSVTTIAFQRTVALEDCCARGVTRGGVMASGGSDGNVVVWDLAFKKPIASIECAHRGGVAALAFIPGKNVLVSSGGDNALKLWSIPPGCEKLLLLKQRAGQNAPPVRIRYFRERKGGPSQSADGADCRILCAGRDRSLWMFHTSRPEQNRELSQGSRPYQTTMRNGRLPLIVDFDAVGTSGRSWCNIVTSHLYSQHVFTWSSQHLSLGNVALQLGHNNRSGITPHRNNSARQPCRRVSSSGVLYPYALSVTLSTCGNFGFVGYSSGGICQFNMQSGHVCGSFPREQVIHERNHRGAMQSRGHEGPVYGLACGSLNESVVSVGHDGAFQFCCVFIFLVKIVIAHVLVYDRRFLPSEYVGTVRWWDVGKRTCDSFAAIGSPPLPSTLLVLHRDSGLVAVAAIDAKVRIFDMASRRLVRRFASGQSGVINDMAFRYGTVQFSYLFSMFDVCS